MQCKPHSKVHRRAIYRLYRRFHVSICHPPRPARLPLAQYSRNLGDDSFSKTGTGQCQEVSPHASGRSSGTVCLLEFRQAINIQTHALRTSRISYTTEHARIGAREARHVG